MVNKSWRRHATDWIPSWPTFFLLGEKRIEMIWNSPCCHSILNNVHVTVTYQKLIWLPANSVEWKSRAVARLPEYYLSAYVGRRRQYGWWFEALRYSEHLTVQHSLDCCVLKCFHAENLRSQNSTADYIKPTFSVSSVGNIIIQTAAQMDPL